MHECPRCGKLTDGAWSEGGLKWAICDDCMRNEREQFNRDYEKCLEQGRRYGKTGNVNEFRY
jgi:hypothetical protein